MELGSRSELGVVSESFTEKVSRTINDTDVTGNADDETPTCLIEQEDRDRVLKSESEWT
ncbi:HVA1 family protein, partial [Aurantimonas marina]|uniref:HVA1 family protein n=1 Tax=Aurantimonas marina TaxID=2780508 RepID=UPI0038CBFB89